MPFAASSPWPLKALHAVGILHVCTRRYAHKPSQAALALEPAPSTFSTMIVIPPRAAGNGFALSHVPPPVDAHGIATTAHLRCHLPTPRDRVKLALFLSPPIILRKKRGEVIFEGMS